MADAVVRGGTVVYPDRRIRADLRISDGRIVEIAEELPGAGHEIDARGLHIFPGLIDVHLHFNEPGRTVWEGAETGSHALAAGGGTLFFDMPLNSTPCTVSAAEVDRKRQALEASSVADFGLWGGLIPGSVEHMAPMAERGVVGFKAFMCDSGLPEFPRADDRTLRDGMREAARLDLPVAVHAESQEMTSALAAAMTGSTARDFLDSRPVAAELEAIVRATDIAGEAGARLHIVHVSTGSGVMKAREARARGVDVSVETCPHYLFFTEEDLETIGVAAKCAPPLRDPDDQAELWGHVVDGLVDLIASDHSPSEPSLKKPGDFRTSWGGVAGVQSTLAVLFERGLDGRRLRFEQIAGLVAANPAQRFRIPSKGALTPGNDADLLLVDPARSYTLEAAHLLQRHKISPYIGFEFNGVVVRTIRRGETIFLDGKIVAETKGAFVRPRQG
ncbi:MAG TPA: allantoinase AllB [Vicinamibacterales bacterium]|nr:allantoinase AllB [Vicinamibacterales bacterium]